MTDPLSSYPVVLRQAIAWGDMDVHGHVNNIVYYRYMENARIAYYERVGKYALEAETGVGFVLAANACRFRVPLAYPGVVLVGARVSTVGDDRATMQYILVRDADRRVAAEGDATLVAFDLRKRVKAAFPDALRRRIIELQGGLG